MHLWSTFSPHATTACCQYMFTGHSKPLYAIFPIQFIWRAAIVVLMLGMLYFFSLTVLLCRWYSATRHIEIRSILLILLCRNTSNLLSNPCCSAQVLYLQKSKLVSGMCCRCRHVVCSRSLIKCPFVY